MPRTLKTATLAGFCATGLVMFVVFAGPARIIGGFRAGDSKTSRLQNDLIESVTTSTADGTTLRKSRDYFMTPGKSRHEILFPASEAGTVLAFFAVCMDAASGIN